MSGRGFGPYFLLMMPDVQKEVALSETQKQQITKLLQSSMGGFGGPPPGGAPPRNANPPKGEQPRPNMEDMMKRMQDMEKKVAAILKPAQKTRLDQLSLQMQGPQALAREDIASKVGLTAKQKTSIRSIMEKSRPQFGRPNQGGQQQDWEKIRKEMQAKREAANKTILATLTADQRAKWAKLTGKPFKFAPRPMGGPGGGGSGRPPGGGRGGE